MNSQKLVEIYHCGWGGGAWSKAEIDLKDTQIATA